MKTLKILGIIMLLPTALVFFPVAISLGLAWIFWKNKRIHNQYFRIALISCFLLFALFFGSAEIFALSKTINTARKTEPTLSQIAKKLTITTTPTLPITPTQATQTQAKISADLTDVNTEEATSTDITGSTKIPTIIVQHESAIYPNSSLTPGEVFSSVAKEQVCASGYTATVRNVSASLHKQVYVEYGISYPQAAGAYEVDHFIPLELGGDNSIKNLWPEPANPAPGFHQKDQVENYLHKQVCSGAILLAEAQREIQIDWYAVYIQVSGGAAMNNSGSTTTANTGSSNTAPATSTGTTPDHPAGATGKCNDGTYTSAINHQGACSQHNGVANWY